VFLRIFLVLYNYNFVENNEALWVSTKCMIKKQQYHFLRAEALATLLQLEGVAPQHWHVKAIGTFRKSFRNDIDAIHYDDNTQQYSISMNRDSIYDQLPEGLFHQTRGNAHNNTLHNVLAEHKRFQEEERNARRFFAPIENSLFRLRCDNWNLEQSIQLSIAHNTVDDALFDFWGIEDLKGNILGKRLLQLIPYAAILVGNLTLTEQALSWILNQRVCINQLEKPVLEAQTSPISDWGNLGEDSVLGTCSKEWLPIWIIHIMDLDYTTLNQFIIGGEHEKVLHHFRNLFTPLMVEVAYVYEQQPSSNIHQEQILGFGATI
jgi:hypothetical protein